MCIRDSQKGGVPAAPSGTATLLRLSPNYQFYPRTLLAVTYFRYPRLSWLDGRCVQDVYKRQHHRCKVHPDSHFLLLALSYFSAALSEIAQCRPLVGTHLALTVQLAEDVYKRQAYRSLSRPSSPPRAKASAMRPCLLLVLPTTYGRYILSALTLLFSVTSCQRSFENIPIIGLSRVENNGFEPLTPCVQSRCSSQLS